MNLIICKDYAEISNKAADIVAGVINGKRACLGLATGSTPEGMYDRLAELCKEGKCDFSKTTTFNLDEYYPISPDNTQSYRYYMNKNLFDRVNIDKANTYVPNGETQNATDECHKYEEKIAAAGGIDLQVIGIGANGHIGFNEPGDSLHLLTHVTKLSARTLEDNSRYFESIDKMPKEALTMGMKSIFSARSILVLVSGRAKHPALKKLLEGNLTTSCPVTLINLHPNVTVLCDKSAYYGE